MHEKELLMVKTLWTFFSFQCQFRHGVTILFLYDIFVSNLDYLWCWFGQQFSDFGYTKPALSPSKDSLNSSESHGVVSLPYCNCMGWNNTFISPQKCFFHHTDVKIYKIRSLWTLVFSISLSCKTYSYLGLHAR